MRCCTLLALVCLVGLTGCPNRANIRPEDGQTELIDRFFKAMVSDEVKDDKKLVSPAWVEANDIDLDDYFINWYSGAEDYEVESVEGDRVTMLVKYYGGTDMRMIIQTSFENDRHYIVPGGHDDEYIHPWLKAESAGED
jgi:hypothetical protein